MTLGTSLTVGSAYHLLNRIRLTKHRRNILIDPQPTHVAFFGLTVQQSAAAGCLQIDQRIQRAMDAKATQGDSIVRVIEEAAKRSLHSDPRGRSA